MRPLSHTIHYTPYLSECKYYLFYFINSIQENLLILKLKFHRPAVIMLCVLASIAEDSSGQTSPLSTQHLGVRVKIMCLGKVSSWGLLLSWHVDMWINVLTCWKNVRKEHEKNRNEMKSFASKNEFLHFQKNTIIFIIS